MIKSKHAKHAIRDVGATIDRCSKDLTYRQETKEERKETKKKRNKREWGGALVRCGIVPIESR